MVSAWPWLRVVGACVCGSLWNLGSVGVALSPLSVVLWRRADTRLEAALSMTAYYAGVATPSALGVLKTGGYGAWSGVELVGLAWVLSAAMGGVWAAGWSPAVRPMSVVGTLRTGALLLLTAAPGLGVLGLAHPFTAAGAWLPGLGWVGLALHVIVLSVAPSRGLVLIAAVALLRVSTGSQETPPSPFLGARTAISVPTDLYDFGGQFVAATRAQREAGRLLARSHLVVLPEGVGGLWTEAMRELWSARERASTVVLGATLVSYEGAYEHYEAAAVALLPDGTERVLAQRVPLPFLLDDPFRPDGYRGHWLGEGVLELGGHQAGVVICYEQLLVFPVLVSIAAGADSLVGLANVAAFDGSGLSRWQGAAMHAWARLFRLPLALALNA